MALISLRQLLDHAAENSYGVPAFNVNNLEQVRAIMMGADEVNSPVILQASAGARKYAGSNFLKHLIQAAIEEFPHIPIVMHQDHGQSPAVCMAAIRSGFTSVMMDGSLEATAKRSPPRRKAFIIVVGVEFCPPPPKRVFLDAACESRAPHDAVHAVRDRARSRRIGANGGRARACSVGPARRVPAPSGE